MLEMEVKEAAFNKASAEVRARFLQNVIRNAARLAGQIAFPGTAVDAALGVDGFNRRRAVDRLRQCRQSA